MQDPSNGKMDEARRYYIKMRVVPVLLLLAFLNIILIIVALVHPVPNFALSASLFYIQSRDANAFSRRSFASIPGIHGHLREKVDPEGPSRIAHSASAKAIRFEQLASMRPLARRCNDAPRAGDTDRCVPNLGDIDASTTGERSTITHVTTLTSSRTPTTVGEASTIPAPSFTAILPGTSATPVPVVNRVDAGTFTALWIGVLGICLQRASGSLICTGSSITPDFRSTYEQSRLGTAITSRLPQSTKGEALGFIIGIMLFGIFFVYLALATLTPTYIWTPYGKRGTPANNYQWTLGLNSLIACGALFSITISTIQLRNAFRKAISSLEAIDTGLITELGSSFGQLYAVCAIGGVILLACIALVYLMGERQVKRRVTANQDFDFDLLEDLHAMSVAGSQIGGSRTGSA